MSRPAWIRLIEILLILPATLLLIPLASFFAAGMLVAILKGTLEGYSEPATIRIMLAFLAAPFSMAALWLAIILPPRNRLLRVTLLLAILIGIAETFYWLWTFARQPEFHDWTIWLVMLAGPVLVGARNLIRLARVP